MLIPLISVFLATQAQAAGVSLSKAQFLEGMKSGMPAQFCADRTYFRKCFTLKSEDCTKEVAADYGACAEKLKSGMPDTFHQPTDGQNWGQQLGTCVGQKFEENEAKVRVKSTDCDNMDKWSKRQSEKNRI